MEFRRSKFLRLPADKSELLKTVGCLMDLFCADLSDVCVPLIQELDNISFLNLSGSASRSRSRFWETIPTYPSPNPTLTLTSHLRQNVGLGEGYLDTVSQNLLALIY